MSQNRVIIDPTVITVTTNLENLENSDQTDDHLITEEEEEAHLPARANLPAQTCRFFPPIKNC